MNEHNAQGNEQAASPAKPVKNNNLGSTTPMKNNTMGTAPTGNNPSGAISPEKSQNPSAMSPMIKKTDNMHQAPGHSDMMPSKKHQTQPGYYQPGGMRADYPETTMGQTGYFPSATPQTGMYPSMSQTGMTPYAMQPADVPQRNMLQPPQTPGMAPQNGASRTSFMSSGVGARNSVLSSTDFTQGFLQTQIGRHVKVEFLLGTGMLIDREGDLVKVGTDYIIIQETETDDYLLCDIYSIRFVRFYY